jgi:hypothetical protein
MEKSVTHNETIFDLAKGTECEPKFEPTSFPTPDPFLEYNGVQFGIGMDAKLYIKEDGKWRKA